MSYVTQEMLVDRFGERLLLDLTDRDEPPAGEIDSAIVIRALADTDAVIDGYLAGRYALPLATTPPLVADLAAQIAIYKLHVYAPDPKIADDYKAAMALLGKIADGQVRLPVAGADPQGSGSAGVEAIDRERPLTPETLTGFI